LIFDCCLILYHQMSSSSSSSSHKKTVRQDYIAKVRYTNNLPPPPLNPKFIKYNTTDPISTQQEGEHLISSLFRKENFQSLMGRIDESFGLELNLINNHGFLSEDKMNESIGKLEYSQLHPKDRALLRDAGIGKISKVEPGVSFLRRTEYIAEERSGSKSGTNLSTVENEEIKNNKKMTNDDHFDPDSQLLNVEKGFTVANESLHNLKNLKHPRKKHLRAVNTWPLLPDTSMMDNSFLDLKFVGSASINREMQMLKQQRGAKFNAKAANQALESAIFKPIKSEDGEWVSMYKLDEQKDEEKVVDLYDKLHSTVREQPINLLDEEDEPSEAYNFKYVKNYDMTYQGFQHENEELAIKFVSDEQEVNGKTTKKRKIAYYYPIGNGHNKIRIRSYGISRRRRRGGRGN
ncbi:hypothetical protein G210_2597, partial [Candida maltosa Xu316]